MVKKIIKNKKAYYLCQEYNFVYKDNETAEKCEAWCKKYHNCSLEITRHAVKI